MLPSVPISVGELVDKRTILAIKLERITDSAKLRHILNEKKELDYVCKRLELDLYPEFSSLEARLLEINEELWSIEDAIRQKEAEKDFGDSFIDLARSVYLKNDERAAIKREINHLVGSYLEEAKSY